MSDQNYFSNTNIIGDFNDSTIDNSGYGVLSAAEKNQTYFAYFTSVGSTTPEIIDQTSYFIKYLIDAQGNVVAPQPNSIDILNMVQNFEPGRLVNVTSLEGTTTFNVLLGTKLITDVGKIETLLVSQTGYGVNDHVNSIDFVSSNAIYTYSDWDFSLIVRKNTYAPQQLLTPAFQTVAFDYETLDPQNQFVNTVGNYYYGFGNSTISANNPVSFKTDLYINPGLSYINYGIGDTIVTASVNINILIVTASSDNPSLYGYVLAQNTFNVTTQQSVVVTSPFANFSSGSRVKVLISATPTFPSTNFSTYSYPEIKVGSYFTATPQYLYNLIATSSFFTTGSTNDIYLTSSIAINNAYYNSMVPKTPAASLAPVGIGFSNITNIFHPRPGDYIRFEYNPFKTYKIYEVIENSDQNVVFRLNKGIFAGTNINNFVIYRINPNSGNQIILDVQKPTSTTGQPLTGFIKPQYMTKELEDNFTTIINKLNAEGTLS